MKKQIDSAGRVCVLALRGGEWSLLGCLAARTPVESYENKKENVSDCDNPYRISLSLDVAQMSKIDEAVRSNAAPKFRIRMRIERHGGWSERKVEVKHNWPVQY